MAEQNKKVERVSAFTKPAKSIPLVSTAPIGVSTNVSTTKPYQEFFQRFVVLDPNARTLPNGDGTIRISPFDDYIIFTLYDDTVGSVPVDPANQKQENPNEAAAFVNTAESPIDLSNVGTLTLVFVGENDEIRIPNWTQVQNVDLSQGQVLFRIDKESSKKILSLLNEIDYGVDDGKPEEEVLARIGQEALNDWNTNAVLPPGWLFDKNQAIKDIKLFAQNLIQTAGAKTVLLVTSNGIARFFPTLLADAPEFYKKESLKLKTGSLSSFLFKNNQFQCEFWGRKP